MIENTPDLIVDVPAEELLGEVWEKLRAERRIPIATYRLQLNRDFTFADARAQVAYLHALGISHCYASPYFRARSESTHGYDICDHNALNPSIGSEEDYQALVAELHAHGMGQILDTVPNHMGIGEEGNSWWQDVLENGPSSPYADFFDIDWTPLKSELENKVLLPVLGDQYGKVLERQELKLRYHEGAFSIQYWERGFPLAPRTYALVLQSLLERLLDVLPEDDEHVLELQSIITALSHLPPRTETDPERIKERHREREIIKRRLLRLTDDSEQVRDVMAATIQQFNGSPGDPRSFDQLDELIRAQAYRLSYWRVATEQINYRRFFDVNDLAAIRMERPEVFEATHGLILRLLGEGAVDGLRIDHPDGLWDPAGYFLALQKAYVLDRCRREFLRDNLEAEWAQIEPEISRHLDELAQENPLAPDLRALPLYVEKILARGEALPQEWAVWGTSGYDFLNAVNGIFVDSANEKVFTDLYHAFIKEKVNFAELMYTNKKLVMQVSLASEINVLAHLLGRISERSRLHRDFTMNSLTDAIRELIACFGVYRTYIRGCDERVDKRDQAAIEAAVARAKKRNPAMDVSIFDFIRDILLLQYPAHFDEDDRAAQCEWVMKFQQCCGPVMAKGVEDTAFYIYNRLVSLNEVGGEPQHFGTSVATFHRLNAERQRRWPHAMLTTSTHDTKRSEDVRARINVLSEMPREWKGRLTRWSRLNRRKKSAVDGQPAPGRNDEYLLYQTLLGTWPLAPMGEAEHAVYVERIVAYMLKALRESKCNTSWLNPNTSYEQAAERFVRSILDRSPENEFLSDLESWSRRVAEGGMINSLAQTLLKLTAPGVPDIYQGNELWDWSLVDPDNRRAVDYAARDAALQSLIGRGAVEGEELLGFVRELVDTRDDGRIKLYLTQRVLRFRAEHSDLFARGDYVPLEATGAKRDHICAFARTHGTNTTVVVAPRLLDHLHGGRPWSDASAGKAWADTALIVSGARPGQRFRNVLTGEVLVAGEQDGAAVLPLAELFAHLPLALVQPLEEVAA